MSLHVRLANVLQLATETSKTNPRKPGPECLIIIKLLALFPKANVRGFIDVRPLAFWPTNQSLKLSTKREFPEKIVIETISRSKSFLNDLQFRSILLFI